MKKWFSFTKAKDRFALTECLFEETRMIPRELRVAIVIPAFNEETVIDGTIRSLLLAGADKSDIFIVDDQSTDKTAFLANQAGVNVRTVYSNGGKAKAQQHVVAWFELLSRYDWLIFLDGDTLVDPKFIIEMRLAAINSPETALFVGQVKSTKDSHIFSASRAFDYTYGQDVAKHGQSNFGVVFVSPGCASMYSTKFFSQVEIDSGTLAEDMDLTIQIHRAGGTVKYVPSACVYTQDPSTFTDYHKQILRWYRGYWQVVKKHRIFSFRSKQRVDWYMILLSVDAVVFNRVAWLIYMMLAMPTVLPSVFALDLGVSFIIALYAGIKTKRADVVFKFPIYYWISYLNFYAYFRTFFEIVVLKRELLAWNKVARYKFSNHQS